MFEDVAADTPQSSERSTARSNPHGRTNMTDEDKGDVLADDGKILECFHFITRKVLRKNARGKMRQHNCVLDCVGNNRDKLDPWWLTVLRKKHAARTTSEKMTYLYNALRCDDTESGAPMVVETCTVSGVKLCTRCFRVAFNVNKNTWTRLNTGAEEGKDPVTGRPVPNEVNRTLTKQPIDAFIGTQVKALAEWQPRKKELHMDLVKPRVLLRRFKSALKHRFALNTALYTKVDGADQFHFSDNYFRKRWQFRLKQASDTFPKLCLRLHKGVSSKCFSCSRCDRRADCAKTPKEREYWKTQKEAHLLFVFMERVLLNEREFVAEMDNRVLHIIMDGWDSMKTVAPSWADIMGELVGKYKNFVKMKLSGVLVTGWRLFLGRTFPWVSTGANLACTVLIHTLAMYQYEHKDVGLPPHLELLADGGSENINKEFMMLCCWLVTKQVFQTISIRRLPVGHTHNGLDQCFQSPSQHFHGPAGVDAVTPDAWMFEVRVNEGLASVCKGVQGGARGCKGVQGCVLGF